VGQATQPSSAQQQNGAAVPPAPAPPVSQLPEVEVIQKKTAPASVSAPKKAAPRKKTAAAPPQAPPIEPEQTAAKPEAGGIDSGTVSISPVAGSEIPISKYPAAVGRASQQDIAKFKEASVPEVLQNTVPGVVLSDAQGNVYQRTLQYRGFDAGPVNGQAQGLAVYQNGVRINESFGDIVNWDFLPDNAVSGIAILGANPVYGLNAIGGAIGISMRDGFNFQGVEIEMRFGSFGHKEGSLAAGARSGNWSAFVAGQIVDEDGFREFSPARVHRYYGDIGVKGEGSELHLSVTHADNNVGVTAAAPEQLLDLGWKKTFTSPQTTDNEMTMLSTNGSVKATSTLTFAGVGYYRWFDQKHVDGNIGEFERCNVSTSNASGIGGVSSTRRALCREDDDSPKGLVKDQFGNPLVVLGSRADPRFNGVPLSQLGSIDRTSQNAETYGGSLQAIEKTPLFGLPNFFVAGASYDHGMVDYTASSELGYFGPRFVVNSFSPNIYMTAPAEVYPRSLTTTNDYVGLFFSNTTEVFKDFALTFGGRWNYARIELQNHSPLPAAYLHLDPTKADDRISGVHEFYRFNPAVGATYELLRGLTLYGGYSEANRAPTPGELACADPEYPCLIESFLTADPPLKQVVSQTFELGLRGRLGSFANDERLEWTAGLFRTENTDDITAIASQSNGRGYFQNAGDTLRQGVEAGIIYQNRWWSAYANYSYVNATFETANVFASRDNPMHFICPGTDPSAEDKAYCIGVNKGDRIPGVPRHRFKIGADYQVTSRWTVGGDVVAVSNQILFGDEGNDTPPLGGYAKLDLRTSYNVTDSVQIFGMVDNVLDARYGLFGNYYNLNAANGAAKADPSFSGVTFTDPRSITPAPPVAAYAGVKIRY
jgi:outer membrane receptor protein involved in Fe transport